MGEKTEIAWTDHTFNPWWGCQRVSPGCENCYAEAFAKRTGHAVWGASQPRRFFKDKHWNEPLKWDAAAKAAGVRRRVFCASMSDVFEDRDDLLEARARLAELVAVTPWLDWLFLTKRPQHARRLWTIACGDARGKMSDCVCGQHQRSPLFDLPAPTGRWASNIWLGTTTEDQQRVEERVLQLLAVPAAVRFLSAEPLLGPVNLGLLGTMPKSTHPSYTMVHQLLHWVIVGGESGGGARACDVPAVRSVVEQCKQAGVAVFVKQLGAMARMEVREPTAEDLADHEARRLRRRGARRGEKLVQIATYLKLKHPKGGDMDEWPEDLRVREFPTGAA